MRPSTRRRQLSLAAALLWLWGFELGPNLHLGLHAALAPHHHADDIAAEFGLGEWSAGDDDDDHDHDHDHGDDHARDDHDAVHVAQGASRPGADTPDRAGEPAAPALERLAAGHGRHSLQHRGLAILQPAPASPQVPEPALHGSYLPRPLLERPRARCPLRLVARGPPPAMATRGVTSQGTQARRPTYRD